MVGNKVSFVICFAGSWLNAACCVCRLKYSQRNTLQQVFFPKSLEACTQHSMYAFISITLHVLDSLAVHHQLHCAGVPVARLCDAHTGNTMHALKRML